MHRHYSFFSDKAKNHFIEQGIASCIASAYFASTDTFRAELLRRNRHSLTHPLPPETIAEAAKGSEQTHGLNTSHRGGTPPVRLEKDNLMIHFIIELNGVHGMAAGVRVRIQERDDLCADLGIDSPKN